MKHFLLTAAAAAMVLALGSCTKTETVNVSDANYIGFDNAFVGNPTKAIAEVKTDDIDHFIVYGGYEDNQNLFNDVKVSKNSNGEWTYSPLQKWEDNKTYRFAAYYPETLTLTVTPTFDYATGSLTFTNVVVNNNLNQVDFIYDKSGDISSETNSPRAKVPFTFEHMFSMVQFTIKSGFAEDVVVGISDFKFYGMNSKSTLTDGAWAAATDQILVDNAIVLKNENAQASKDPVDYVDNCVVMPQTFADATVNVEFTVTLTSSEENGGSLVDIPEGDRIATITAAIPTYTWKPGFRYNYKVTIDGQNLDYITFDEPEVSTWEKNNDIDLGNTEV